jgi:hypothetical protein
VISSAGGKNATVCVVPFNGLGTVGPTIISVDLVFDEPRCENKMRHLIASQITSVLSTLGAFADIRREVQSKF